MKKIEYTIIGIVVCFLILLIYGCTPLITGISHEYPSNWPSYYIEDSNCQNISGKYQNMGKEKYDLGGDQRSLGYRLLGFHALSVEDNEDRGKMISEITKARVVEINQQNESMISVYVKLSDDKEYTKTWHINNIDATCSEGWLWLTQGSSKGVDSLGPYYSSYKIGLRKAVDGSLIGQEHNSGIGVAVWLIPMAGNQIMWYRWLSSE